MPICQLKSEEKEKIIWRDGRESNRHPEGLGFESSAASNYATSAKLGGEGGSSTRMSEDADF
jgi:hypothetical protein